MWSQQIRVPLKFSFRGLFLMCQLKYCSVVYSDFSYLHLDFFIFPLGNTPLHLAVLLGHKGIVIHFCLLQFSGYVVGKTLFSGCSCRFLKETCTCKSNFWFNLRMYSTFNGQTKVYFMKKQSVFNYEKHDIHVEKTC